MIGHFDGDGRQVAGEPSAQAVISNTDAYSECFLYVEAEGDGVVIRELRDYFEIDDDLGVFALSGMEVVVVHGAEKSAVPTDDFVSWRAKVEVYAAASTPGRIVVELVRSVMTCLRGNGHRVVASCDFEDELPQDDWADIKAGRRAERQAPDRAPTRAEVRAILVDLAVGRTSPREADEWATPWVVAHDALVEDRVIWRALTVLCGADLEVSTGVLLHGPADFRAWLERFDEDVATDSGW
jgi:hypothetical protein